MGLYKPSNQGVRGEATESSNYAFPLLVAYAQLVCVVWFVHILITTADKNDFGVIGALWPMMLSAFIAPVAFISGTYYFYKYRSDPLYKKLVVGAALLISVLVWAVFPALRN